MQSMRNLLFAAAIISIATSSAAAADHPAFTLRLRESLRSIPNQPDRVSQEILIAQRTDGSRVEVRRMSPGQPGDHRIRTVILPDMQHIKIADAVGLKTTGVPWPPENVTRYRKSRPTPESDCLLTGLGGDNVLGYKVAGKETIRGLAVIKLVRDGAPSPLQAWQAPALGCEEVQRNARFDNMILSHTSDLEMVSYTLGDPDPALFEFASLREATPGVFYLTLFKAAGWPPGDLAKLAAQYKQMDEAYWKTRDAAGIRPPE